MKPITWIHLAERGIMLESYLVSERHFCYRSRYSASLDDTRRKDVSFLDEQLDSLQHLLICIPIFRCRIIPDLASRFLEFRGNDMIYIAGVRSECYDTRRDIYLLSVFGLVGSRHAVLAADSGDSQFFLRFERTEQRAIAFSSSLGIVVQSSEIFLQ